MKSSDNQKIGRNFASFIVGIGCGILISILLYISFSTTSILSHVFGMTFGNPFSNSVITVQFKSSDRKAIIVGLDRKLSQDNSLFEQDLNGNLSIPIDALENPPPLENPDWEKNLSPAHIPGYLAQELHLKKKVFVGIIHPSASSQPEPNLIGSTWAKEWVSKGNGDITLYAPMGTDVAMSERINLYRLSGSSNPNEVSPAMLYQALNDICSQHIDTHHHFYIVNSNTYVSLPRLLNFTSRLDDSLSLWIGKRVVTKSLERKYMNDPEFHCPVDPGFVLTRKALQMLCPRLPTCSVAYSNAGTSASVQFARCVLRFLNRTCTYFTDTDLFYEATAEELVDPYSDKCHYGESISVHPLSDEKTLKKLHHFFLAKRLNETKRLNEYYHDVIQKMDRVLVQEGGMADDRLILGKEGNANRYQHGDVISWDKIESDGGRKKIYITDGPEPSQDLTKSDEAVLNKVETLAMKQMKEEYGNDGSFSIGSSFRRVVPGVGFQYMVDILKNNDEIATVFIDQPYDRMHSLGTRVAPNVIVNFVLPLQDGSPDFKEFMQMFEQACMSVERAKNVALLVVIYSSNKESKQIDEKASETLSLLNLYKQKYPDLSLRWINGGSGALSRVEGITMAVRALPAETLICSTDLFTQMSPEFLHHARLNTVLGERLFFPMTFQQLEADGIGIHEISKGTGFWRSFDYSIFCGYKQDITRACGGEAFSSGADLYERALSSGLDVFRAPEHSLSVTWHERDCKSELLSLQEQTSCEETAKSLHLVSSSVLR